MKTSPNWQRLTAPPPSYLPASDCFHPLGHFRGHLTALCRGRRGTYASPSRCQASLTTAGPGEWVVPNLCARLPQQGRHNGAIHTDAVWSSEESRKPARAVCWMRFVADTSLCVCMCVCVYMREREMVQAISIIAHDYYTKVMREEQSVTQPLPHHHPLVILQQISS